MGAMDMDSYEEGVDGGGVENLTHHEAAMGAVCRGDDEQEEDGDEDFSAMGTGDDNLDSSMHSCDDLGGGGVSSSSLADVGSSGSLDGVRHRHQAAGGGSRSSEGHYDRRADLDRMTSRRSFAAFDSDHAVAGGTSHYHARPRSMTNGPPTAQEDDVGKQSDKVRTVSWACL